MFWTARFGLVFVALLQPWFSCPAFPAFRRLALAGCRSSGTSRLQSGVGCLGGLLRNPVLFFTTLGSIFDCIGFHSFYFYVIEKGEYCKSYD